MTAVHNRFHRAFTMVELVVALSVMLILASMALLVVPDVLSQDRTTEGAARLQQHLMIAKARATRDKLPRGIRLVNNGAGFATELQYLESPPAYFPPNPSEPNYTYASSPLVEFAYEPAVDGTMPLINPQPNNGRKIYIKNLPVEAESALASEGGIVVMPTLQNLWIKIAPGGFDASTKIATPQMDTGVTPYPDTIGSGTKVLTYGFGIFSSPQPMLGEPVQQLPSNVGVDMTSSSGLNGGDILFTPAGDVMSSGSGQVFLWVRDVTRTGGDPAKVTSPLGNYQTGGEQQVVAIKARSGAVSVFPIAWPPATDPFQFAK